MALIGEMPHDMKAMSIEMPTGYAEPHRGLGSVRSGMARHLEHLLFQAATMGYRATGDFVYEPSIHLAERMERLDSIEFNPEAREAYKETQQQRKEEFDEAIERHKAHEKAMAPYVAATSIANTAADDYKSKHETNKTASMVEKVAAALSPEKGGL